MTDAPISLAFHDFGGAGRLRLVLGPPLGTSTYHLWSGVAHRLTDQFHVTGWDLPGHGASPPASAYTVADVAAAVLRGVAVPFVYAGVSIGGAVGLQLLLDSAGRVTAATVISTGARIGEPAAWRERAAQVRAQGTGALLDATPARWFAPPNRQTAAAKALLADLAATEPVSYAAACEALAGFDVRARLADIDQSVLAIAGRQDPVTPPSSLRQIADGVPHGRLVILDGVSHQAPVEAPAEVAALIAEVPVVTDVTEARLRARGMRARREVLGDEHVDSRAAESADPFTADFQDLITRYAWGAIWTRPGLDRRSRSLITLTALVARGHYDELEMHVRAALTNGLTKDEVKELLLQTAIYCGVPDANVAFRIAKRVFDEDGP